MARRRRGRWWHPRRIDVLLGIGIVGFLSQILRAQPSEALVYASLILMGVPVINRFDDTPRQPPPDEEP